MLGQPFNGQVIFTGQVEELFENKFGSLEYRSLDLKFETLNLDEYQKTATINYPNNYEFTRITEFKKIHPVTTGVTTILKEYPQHYIPGVNTPYYPVFDSENKLRYEMYATAASQVKNLILLGRLAEYKYYNMDNIVEHALNLFEEKF